MATVTGTGDLDAAAVAAALKDAMRGLGTNESMIIREVSSMNNEERQLVKTEYKGAYGQDLEDDLKSELGGHFEDVVMAAMTEPRLYDAQQLNGAISGAGTDETTLVEILCTRSPEEIETIKELYKQEYETELEEACLGDTSGSFARLLVSQVNAARDTSDDVDDDMAQEDAQTLFDSGEASWGTDESEFNRVLSMRNYAQLRATFKAYEGIAGHTIEEGIDSEMTGSVQKGCLAIVKVARNVSGFFAERLHESLAGAGTDDAHLIRIIVSRSEVDLADVADIYAVMYERTLADHIDSDCSGDYKEFLLALLGQMPED